MPRKSSFEIFSIYGQIEEVAANIMINEHGCWMIPANQVPIEHLYNDAGIKVKFAVRIPQNLVKTFDDLIVGLRA